MTCDRCGRPTSRRRHCADCARELRQEERAQLEDADLLTFETIKRCRECGSTSDDVDGDYLDDEPGAWVCDGCADRDVLITDGGEPLDGDASQLHAQSPWTYFSKSLFGDWIVNEQLNPFSGRQIVDKQSELVPTLERSNARVGSLFVGPFTDEFDCPSVVGLDFELPHSSHYSSSTYRCTLEWIRDRPKARLLGGDSN